MRQNFSIIFCGPFLDLLLELVEGDVGDIKTPQVDRLVDDMEDQQPGVEFFRQNQGAYSKA